MDTLNLVLILGVVLGGRLGYVLFYNPGYYLGHPLEIVATWQGGMSFHGGCIGTILCGLLYCRRNHLNFWKTVDLYVAAAPIGIGLGRLGNFINGELFGRVTDVPWAMVFPEGGPLPRHPSQLYEAFLEGVLLFLILWAVKGFPWRHPQPKWWPHGSILAFFLICYSLFRFLVEFFREPDAHLGTLIADLSMGQLLSLGMLVLGTILWVVRRKKAVQP
jgi:phosphatidylglycerol:prolipoprotein diacylglycerol transferase